MEIGPATRAAAPRSALQTHSPSRLLHRLDGFPKPPLAFPEVISGTARETSRVSSKRQLSLAPPTFPVDDNRAVFVDFQKVHLEVVFDVATRKAMVHATIDFQQPTAGFPISDLVPDAGTVRVDGEDIDPSAYAEVKDPDRASTLRVLKKELPAGSHRMEISYPLDAGVGWDSKGASFFQNMSDLKNRQFSEQYFPTNYEYDQYSQTLELRIKGAGRDHRLVTNGDVSQRKEGADTIYSVTYPEYFTSSSFFVHLLDPSDWNFAEGVYTSEHGSVPITVYASARGTAEKALERAQNYLGELEERFGRFPHASYKVRISGMGGMEHSGATITSMSALGHETTHQWLARGTIPARGDAGWMDEALASWRDDGYPRARKIKMGWFGYPQLADRSPYIRTTHTSSYSHGAKVMGELDYVFADQGGITEIIKEFVTLYRHQTVTTDMFVGFLSSRWPSHIKYSAKEYFDRKIYGRKGALSEDAAEAHSALSAHIVGLERASQEADYEKAVRSVVAMLAGDAQADAEIRKQLARLPSYLREDLIDVARAKLAAALRKRPVEGVKVPPVKAP